MMYLTNSLDTVIQKLSQRKGELQTMGAANGGYTRLEFRIPSRGLIGYRGDFLTDTKGNGIMNTMHLTDTLHIREISSIVNRDL